MRPPARIHQRRDRSHGADEYLAEFRRRSIAWWPSEKTPATPWEARIDKLELLQASESRATCGRRLSTKCSASWWNRSPIIYLVNPDYLCRDFARAARSAAGSGAAADSVECRVAAA